MQLVGQAGQDRMAWIVMDGPLTGPDRPDRHYPDITVGQERRPRHGKGTCRKGPPPEREAFFVDDFQKDGSDDSGKHTP
jgi:hypothetical protein